MRKTASKNIKGITIEIGGDVTGLDKALDSVDKSIKTTQGELKEVEKLLKLDPENTELLRQKQQLLAKEISTVAERLKTLKTASDQAAKSAENYDAFKAKFDPIQNEIDDTKKKLTEMRTAMKQMEDAGEIDTEQYQKLKTEAQEASKRLTALNKEAKDVREEFGNPISPEQYNRLQREIIKTELDLKGLEDQQKDTGKASDDTGDDMRQLARKVDDAGDSAENAEKDFSGLSDGFSVVKGVAANLVTQGIDLLVDSLSSLITETQETVEDMGKLDTAFKTSNKSVEAGRETFGNFVGLLGETDQAVEAANHLAEMAIAEEDLSKWTTIATGVYAKFGDSLPLEGLTEAANETAKVGEVTGPLADALNWAGISEDSFNESLAACNDEQERAQLITETLSGIYADAGKEYQDTNGDLIAVRKSTAELSAATAELGRVFYPAVAAASSFGASLLEDLTPSIQSVVDALGDMVSGSEDGAEELTEAVESIVSGAAQTIEDLAPDVVGLGTEIIASVASGLISSAPDLISAAGTVVASLYQGIEDNLPTVVSSFVQVIPDIASALISSSMTIQTAAFEMLSGLVSAIPEVSQQLLENLPTLITDFSTGLAEGGPQLIEAAGELFMSLVESLPQAAQSLAENAPQITQALIDGILSTSTSINNAIIQLLTNPQLYTSIANASVQINLAIGQAILGVIGTILSNVASFALQLGKSALNAGKQFLNNIAPGFTQSVSNIWKNLQSAIKKVAQFGSSIISSAKTIGSNFISGIRTKFSSITSTVKSVFTGAIQYIKALPGQALKWGKDFVNGLINGIKSKVNSIVSSVKGIAEKISSYLHFSRPDVGPLHEYEEWMPDFVKGLATGIYDSLPMIQSAANTLAKTISYPAITAATQETLDPNSIHSAIRSGASDASPTIMMDEKSFKRMLRGWGVVFQ